MRKFLLAVFFSLLAFGAHAAGYTCDSIKQYTSCNAGYYMTYSGSYNGTAKTGNACTQCPANSYCTGSTANKVACNVSFNTSISNGTRTCYHTTSSAGAKASSDCTGTANCSCSCNSGYKVSGSGSSCTCVIASCSAGQYMNNGSCTNCPSGYTSAAGATAIGQCYVSCAAGTRVATANAACVSNVTGPWYTSAHTVYYGNISPVNYCMNGYTSSSTVATGHDSYTDCTRSISAGYRVSSQYISARYVKFVTTGNTVNSAGGHMVEIQAWSGTAGSGTNYLSGKTGPTGSSLTNATDGSWSRGTYSSGTTQIWDMGTTYSIGSLKFALYSDGRTYNNVALYLSTDNSNWIQVLATQNIVTQNSSTPTGRLVKLANVTTCGAGTYYGSARTATLGTNYSCTTCPCGNYCPAGATAATSCPAGTYRTSTGGTAESSCSTTAAGNYTTAGACSQTACSTLGPLYTSAAGAKGTTYCYVNITAGKYLASNSDDALTTCTAGYACPGGKFGYLNATNRGRGACQTGSYSASGATVCTICSDGKTTSSTAQSSCNATCSNATGASSWTTPVWNTSYNAAVRYSTNTTTGYYTYVYSNTVYNKCKLNSCNGGYYYTSVNNGTTTAAYQNTCTACEAGTYRSGNNSTATSCSACACGRYSTGGATACTSCSQGYYSTDKTKNACTAISNTQFLDSSSCTLKSCSTETSGNYPNSYGGKSSVAWCYVIVSAGKYIPSAGAAQQTCTSGNYCPGGMQIDQDGSGLDDDTDNDTLLSCSANTGGIYTNSASGASKVGQCYLKLTTGKQVASAGAGMSNCTAGRYCSSTANIYYNTTGGTAVYTGTACVTGSYSGAGASKCTACGDGDNWGMTTTGVGQTSCNKTCPNAVDANGDDAVKGWATATWNTNNTVSNVCVANSCLGGDNGHYLDNGNCPLCSSFANGLYPRSANSGTTKGKEACFLRRSDIPGKHIAHVEDDVATDCQVGFYYPTGDETAVHFGEKYDCKSCAADTYSDRAGMTSCTACLANYHTVGEKISSDACKITCMGGTYLAKANDTKCTQVGAGYWAAQSTVAQGSVGVRNACGTGLTTIGYGAGADEAADCGRILHAGDKSIYLRSVKKTTPSLNIKIGNTTYYGNMTPGALDGYLIIKDGNVTYRVHDDITEFVAGGTTPGTTIDAALEATSIIPASYAAAAGETTWSATLSDGTKVSGNARCSATTGSNGVAGASGFTPEGSGTGCWCQITSPATGARWVYGTANAACTDKCGYYCANNMKGTSTKNVTYRTNLYSTAGILKQ